MKIFKEYFIFVVIGVMPTAIADISIWQWEWWVICSFFWVGVWMHGSVREFGK